jgi:hypothetical protein
MKLQSNNCEIIANEEMNLVCLKFKGGSYFLDHGELDSMQQLLNCRDIEEIRDLVNDYKEMLFEEIFEESSGCCCHR